MNGTNTTLECEQAAEQVLVILEQPWHVYQHSKAAAAENIKVGLIRTPTLTSIFSKTNTDRAKRFSPMKTTFQDEQVG